MKMRIAAAVALVPLLLIASGCGGSSSSGSEPADVFPTSQEDMDQAATEDGYLDAVFACQSLTLLSIDMSQGTVSESVLDQLALIKESATAAAQANERYALLAQFAGGFVDQALNPSAGNEALAATNFDDALMFCEMQGM